jgi:hypothetical protein
MVPLLIISIDSRIKLPDRPRLLRRGGPEYYANLWRLDGHEYVFNGFAREGA